MERAFDPCVFFGDVCTGFDDASDDINVDWITTEPTFKGSGSNWALPLEEKVTVKGACFWRPFKLPCNIDRSFEIAGGSGCDPPLELFKACSSSSCSSLEKNRDKEIPTSCFELSVPYRTELLLEFKINKPTSKSSKITCAVSNASASPASAASPETTPADCDATSEGSGA